MITIDQFFQQWNGKGADFDGAYGFQCMDLAEFYNRDVVGAPRIGGNAIDAWNRYSPQHYNKIPNIANEPTNYPQKGDLVVWGQYPGLTGPFGHIGICKSANNYAFVSFDQNWPVNSLPHFQNHNFNGVIGWLRPKVVEQPVTSVPVTDVALSPGQAKWCYETVANREPENNTVIRGRHLVELISGLSKEIHSK